MARRLKDKDSFRDSRHALTTVGVALACGDAAAARARLELAPRYLDPRTLTELREGLARLEAQGSR
ncbi:MAG: hypothetical protein AB7N76_28860 [Planctomycetota bacterium]